MAKEILLYGPVDDDLAKEIIEEMNESEDTDFILRINTDGGEPQSVGGLIAKLEDAGPKVGKVDDKAYSTGLYAALFCDTVECLDTSLFLLHRAAYSPWFEGSEYFTPELRKNLENLNSIIEKVVRGKIDVVALEEIMNSREDIKGKKLKDVFSMDSRIDVFLNAKEAKKVGIVDKIRKITPEKKAELAAAANARMEKITARHTPPKQENEPPAPTKKHDQNNADMTQQEFKEKFPAVYAAILLEGEKAGMLKGVEQEKDRVEAILVFAEIDMKVCMEAISSGKSLTAKQSNELMLKSFNAKAKADLEDDSNKEVQTDESETGAETGKTKPDAKIKAFEANTRKHLENAGALSKVKVVGKPRAVSIS